MVEMKPSHAAEPEAVEVDDWGLRTTGSGDAGDDENLTSNSEHVKSEAGQESDAENETFLPDWLDNRRLLVIIALTGFGLFGLALFAGLYFVRTILFPITLALVLNLVLNPVVRRLNQWRIPYFIGSALVVAAILGLTVAGIVLLSTPASQWVVDAPRHLRSVEYKLWSIKEPIEKVTAAGEEVDKLTSMEGKKKPVPVEVTKPGVIAQLLDTGGNAAISIFLTLVLLYFLLAGGDRLTVKLMDLAPDWQKKPNVACMVREIQRSMSSYLFATTLINILLGIAIGTSMWLLGMPNSILWGVMATCLNFIPYLGCIIGAGVVCVVALVSKDSLAYAVWAPALYFGINTVEGYFITPTILGRSISLSPLAILISMILWGWIWGIGGLIIAVPLLAVAKIACDHIEPLRPVGRLLGRY